jgi:hypothetical protein
VGWPVEKTVYECADPVFLGSTSDDLFLLYVQCGSEQLIEKTNYTFDRKDLSNGN